MVAVDGEVRREVVDALLRAGYIEERDADDEALLDALSAFIRTENFEERAGAWVVDRAVLRFMRGKG